LLFTAYAHAATIITGKVIGVTDGDTIKVLQNHTQYKIRLYGIDTPEKRQDFGMRAKQFTSGLVYGKNVKVVEKDVDRYGRIVGLVYVGGDTCVNQEIVKNGFAWVYKRYCKDDFCKDWIKFEEQARSSKVGLWSHPTPIPPWEFRHGKQSASKSDMTGTVYHGNNSSKVFHRSGCKAYDCKNCTARFPSREQAISAGYHPCKICNP